MSILGKIFGGSGASREDRELMDLTNQRLAMYGYDLGPSGEIRSCPGAVVKENPTQVALIDVYSSDDETRLVGHINTLTGEISYP